jgi:hypothetical protein
MRTRGGKTIVAPKSPATISLLTAFEEVAKTKPPSPETTWSCSRCTYANESTERRCTLCNSRRPADAVAAPGSKRKRKSMNNENNKDDNKTNVGESSTVMAPGNTVSRKKKRKKIKKNVNILPSPSTSPKQNSSQRCNYDYEGDTEAQLAREELSKKLLGMNGLTRTTPESAVKLDIAQHLTVNLYIKVSSIVNMDISVRTTSGRWKKCLVIRPANKNDQEAIVLWRNKNKTTLRLFGEGAEEWKV